MSNAVFPVLAGLEWDRVRAPVFKTLKQESLSGREARAALWPYPKWRYSLSYEILRSETGYAELQSLMGFFLARQGSFDSFLFSDWEDYTVTLQAIGTGNGSATQWQLARTYGGFTDLIYDIKASPVPKIYVNEVLQTTGYSIGSTGVLTFTSPPTNGHAITATFDYYWRCHFIEDEMEFEAFMYKLWTAKTVEFITDWA